MFGRIITRSTNKPIAPTSSAIRRSHSVADCSVARTGFAGRTNFGLPEPTGGALAMNIFDFDIGAGGASSGPTPFPFLDGGSATIFAPAPRSGASRSSSPAMPTRVNSPYRRA